ncbi:MAG: septum formation inhibitor Maf [Gammaproteobacteria bacterium]|nr:septum formation inhibitor Maf [Gammaproteobacteria bacterium]
MKSGPHLYLASRSPRRAELLRALGVEFAVVDVEVDEMPTAGEAAATYVARLAGAKARAGRGALMTPSSVLAADTTVVIDDAILGKPRDELDAAGMLQRLSNRWHSVYTAVALESRVQSLRVVHTRVKFRTLTRAEIAAYWVSGEPADKAGAYGIQGLGGALVERIDGSYSNVVGLPLVETVELLNEHGVAHRLNL